MRHTSGLVLVLGCFLGACREATVEAGPTYRLESVGGQPLPAPWVTKRWTLVEARLAFTPWWPGSGLGVATSVMTLVDGSGVVAIDSLSRTFSRGGSSIRFDVCRRGAHCPEFLRPYSSARLEANVLIFEREPGLPDLVYRVE